MFIYNYYYRYIKIEFTIYLYIYSKMCYMSLTLLIAGIETKFYIDMQYFLMYLIQF